MQAMPSTVRTSRQQLAILVMLLLCALVYLCGLFGGFLFDDFPNIVDKPELRALDGSLFRWLALAVSSNAGPLRRPISMLSFGVDYWFFGLSPLAFRLTNLAIHLTNGVLLYQLTRRIATRLLTRSSRTAFDSHILALLTAALWLLHPLNVSTVLYVVQRMDELATLFVLLGLLCYVEGRERMSRDLRGLAIAIPGICAFGLLAVLSKENGALITAYALVIEVCCYQFFAGTILENRILKGFLWLTVALPLILFAAFLIAHPQWLANGYAGRDFTLYQRVLSEARILCDYLLWIFLPLPRWMGVYHDDIVTSTGLLHPATTLAAFVFLVMLAVLAWRWRRRSPGFAFAISWFLVGQSMESTILSLELAFDHRNYLPMAGLLLGVVCALTPLIATKLNHRSAAAVCGAIVLALAGTTATWAYAWGDPLRLAMMEAATHPGSARAQYEAGRQIIFKGTAEGHRDAAEERAMPYFERGMRLDPLDVFTPSSLMLIHSHQGQLPTRDSVEDLAWRVRNMRQVRLSPFLVVLTAASTGGLRLTPDQMKILVNAALSNPRLTHSMRAMVLNNYGHYMFQIAHDNQAAVSLTVAAAAEDPTNPLFEINLTRLAMALDDENEARQHLLRAQGLDKAKMYTTVLADLQKKLYTTTDRAAGSEPTLH